METFKITYISIMLVIIFLGVYLLTSMRTEVPEAKIIIIPKTFMQDVSPKPLAPQIKIKRSKLEKDLKILKNRKNKIFKQQEEIKNRIEEIKKGLK